MAPAPKPEIGTAVVLPEQITKASFKTDVERWAPELEKVAYKGFTPERVLAAALQAAVHEPKLFDATPQSLYLAVMKAARWGLDIGDTVHLVPLGKNLAKRGEPDRWVTIVEAWPDYKGLKALAIRQRLIRGMEEYVVYAGDHFQYQLGMDAMLSHRPGGNPATRGSLVGAYTIIRLPFGEKTFNYMGMEDIEAIRAKSRSWGPGKVKLCPPWYAKKTVVRDWLNRQPKQGADLVEALAADAADGEAFDPETGEVLAAPRRGAGEATQQGTEDDDLELDRALASQEHER